MMEQLRTKRRFVRTVITMCASALDTLLVDEDSPVSTLLQHSNLTSAKQADHSAFDRAIPNTFHDDAL